MKTIDIALFALPGNADSKAITALALNNAGFTGSLDSKNIRGNGLFVRRDSVLGDGVVFAIIDAGVYTGEHESYEVAKEGFDAITIVTSSTSAVLGMNGVLNTLPKSDVKKRNSEEFLFAPEEREILDLYHRQAKELGALNYGDEYERLDHNGKLAVFADPVKVVFPRKGDTVITSVTVTGGPQGSFKRPLYMFVKPSAKELAAFQKGVAEQFKA